MSKFNKVISGLAAVSAMMFGLVFSVGVHADNAGNAGNTNVNDCSFGATGFSRNENCTVVGGTNLNAGDITNTVAGIANFVILIISAIAIFFILWGAFQWMAGNEEGGKKKVTSAVIGLIIAISAFLIVRLIIQSGNIVNNAAGQ